MPLTRYTTVILQSPSADINDFVVVVLVFCLDCLDRLPCLPLTSGDLNRFT